MNVSFVYNLCVCMCVPMFELKKSVNAYRLYCSWMIRGPHLFVVLLQFFFFFFQSQSKQ